jgi:hypothetical protein
MCVAPTGFEPVLPPWKETALPRHLNGKRSGDCRQGNALRHRALKQEIDVLLATPEGSRNDQLNRAAFSLGQLIAGGELTEARARAALEAAGRRIGLEGRETRSTIESGLTAGKLEPRHRADLLQDQHPFISIKPTRQDMALTGTAAIGCCTPLRATSRPFVFFPGGTTCSSPPLELVLQAMGVFSAAPRRRSNRTGSFTHHARLWPLLGGA